MEKVKCVFIILHYLAKEDTIECVESIQRNADQYRIVIVDNASPDKSGEELQIKYRDTESVKVILNAENEGFARGNNRGITYAAENYDFDYCVVLNNDTLLLEPFFVEKVDEEYKKSGFAVLGPMIYSADGRCDCNPVRTRLIDASYVENELKSEKRHFVAEKNPFIRAVRNVWFLVKPMFKREKNRRKQFIESAKDVQLHGCFLIFSRKYFEKFRGFCDRTFLYHEEEILHLLVHRAGLLTVYQPTIKIFHKEDASTDAAIKTKHEKRLLRLSNSVRSLEILKELYYSQ